MAKNEQRMWEKTEVSTRNCYNAINCQGTVYCRIGIYGEPGQTWYVDYQGEVIPFSNSTLILKRQAQGDWSLYDSDNNGLNTQRVASRGVLFSSCRNCSNFDNDW